MTDRVPFEFYNGRSAQKKTTFMPLPCGRKTDDMCNRLDRKTTMSAERRTDGIGKTMLWGAVNVRLISDIREVSDDSVVSMSTHFLFWPT